jgi:polyisoprenoid-binding protein YceI
LRLFDPWPIGVLSGVRSCAGRSKYTNDPSTRRLPAGSGVAGKIRVRLRPHGRFQNPSAFFRVISGLFGSVAGNIGADISKECIHIMRKILIVFLTLASAPILATTYTLEPNYTQVIFCWNHLGFSDPAAQVAQGEGTLEFDQTDPTKSSVVVVIPLTSLHTGVPDLDEHLRSKDFFETDRFRTATFKSKKVELGAAKDRLRVTGDLSLHDITKPVTLDVTLLKVGINPRTNLPTIGFDAATTIKRSEFGLGKFVPQVSDEIQIRITSQAAEAKAYAEYNRAEAAAEAAAKDAVKK